MTGEGTMFGTYASTEHLHVARLEQAPGGRSGVRCFEGDTAIHVLEGTVFVFILDENRQRWFEGTTGDGFYVPAGTHYEIRNVTAAPSRAIVAVAPNEIADSGG
jgi:quercetin dioxygenase-like cupin family protein